MTTGAMTSHWWSAVGAVTHRRGKVGCCLIDGGHQYPIGGRRSVGGSASRMPSVSSVPRS